MIHCASLNPGIRKLVETFDWNIISIRDVAANREEIISCDVIIIDEAQRISVEQMKEIDSIVDNCIVFSHDVNQKLNKMNQALKVVKEVNRVSMGNEFKLSSKIRHNKNLSSFIKKLYNLDLIKSDNLAHSDYDCVSFYFTREIVDAKEQIEHLKTLGWKYIYLTTSKYTSEPLDDVRFGSTTSAHTVIGQEFGNVVVTITSNFYYNESKRLSFNGKFYYKPIETLFQAITQTRKRLHFVIVDNDKFLQSCIAICANVDPCEGYSLSVK